MKHIKNIKDFEAINEEIGLKKIWKDWKGYLIALGVVAGISNYTNIKALLGGKLQNEEISDIVNDIENVPTGRNKILIDSIKTSLIDYIKSNKEITPSRRDSVIQAVNNVKIAIVPDRFAKGISGGDIIGCHFNYVDYSIPFDSKQDIYHYLREGIILNDKFFNDGIFVKSDDDVKKLAISHELWHLVDSNLGKVKGKEFDRYSDMLDLAKVLDKDIVTMTPSGKNKFDKKVKEFVKIRKSIGEFKSRSTDKVADEVKNILLGDMKYISDPAEVYVRYHGLKMWLYRKGYINSIDDNINKEHIMKALKDDDLINNFNNQHFDFFQLLFILNIDITDEKDTEGDIESLKNINSIVTNYREFDKTKRDA